MHSAQYALLILINSCIWTLETFSSHHPSGSTEAHSASNALKNVKHDPFFCFDSSPKGQSWLNESASGSAGSAAAAAQGTLPAQSGLPFFCAVSGAAEQPQPFTFDPQAHQTLAAINAAQAALQIPSVAATAIDSQFSGLPLPPLPSNQAASTTDRPQPARRTSSNRNPQDHFQPARYALVPAAAAAPLPDIKKALETIRTPPPLSLPAPAQSLNLTVASELTAFNNTDHSNPSLRIATKPSTPAEEPSYAPMRRERRAKKNTEDESNAANERRNNRKIEIACHYCNKKMQKDSLKNHVMRHEKNFPFKCSHCTFEGVDRSDISRHFFKDHGTAHCQICNELKQDDTHSGHANAALRKHIREDHAQKIQPHSHLKQTREETAEKASPPQLAELLTGAAATAAHMNTAQTPDASTLKQQSPQTERSDSPELSPTTTKKVFDAVIAAADMTDDGK